MLTRSKPLTSLPNCVNLEGSAVFGSDMGSSSMPIVVVLVIKSQSTVDSRLFYLISPGLGPVQRRGKAADGMEALPRPRTSLILTIDDESLESCILRELL